MSIKKQVTQTIKEFQSQGKFPSELNFVSQNLLSPDIPIIVVTQNDVAAFSELNGNPENWKEIISQFQKVYVENFKEDWVAKNFELIYFVGDRFPPHLIISIEENKYFCRKYVLNKIRIKDELERLPFVYFDIVNASNIKIFKGAKDVLKLYNVNDELAKYLSQPGKRPSTLADGSLNDKYGKPVLNQHINQNTLYSFGKSKLVFPAVKLHEIRINNFRAYKGQHTFDLDANVIILYGSNGLGKTSFFDAIDFALTGSVERIEKLYPNNNQKQKAPLRHLSAQEEACSVEFSINDNGRVNKWIRNLADNKNFIKSDDKKVITTQSLIRDVITKSFDKSSTLNIRRLRNLFRATHLFGQDISELTGKLRVEGTIEGEILNHLIALQDYYEATTKINEILRILAKRYDETEEKRVKLRDEINDLKNSVTQTDNIVIQETQLTGIYENVVNDLRDINLIGADFTDSFSSEVLKMLQTITEENKNKHTQRLNNLLANRALIISAQSVKKDLKEAKNKLLEVEKEIKTHQLVVENAYKETDTINNEKQFFEKKLNEVQSKLRNVEWLVDVHSKIKKCNETSTSIEKEITVSDKLLKKLSGEIIVQPKALEDKIKSIEQKNIISQRMKDVKDLISEFEIFQKNNNKLTEMNNIIKKLELNIKKSEEMINADKDKLLKQRNTIEGLQLKLKEEKKVSDPLLNILERVKSFINDEYCPICSKRHESRNDLVCSIDKKISAYSTNLSQLEKSLIVEESKLGKIEGLVNKNKSTLKITQNELNRQKERYQEILKNIDGYKKVAEKLYIDAKDLSISLLKNMMEKNQSDINKIDSELEKIKANIPIIKLEQLKSQIERAKKHKGELELKCNESVKLKKLLIDEAKVKELNLSIKLETLNRNYKLHCEKIIEIKKEISRRNAAIIKINQEKDNRNSKIKSLTGRKIAYENRKTSLEEQDEKANQLAKTFHINLKGDLEEEIDSAKREIHKVLSSLDAIQEKISLLDNYYDKIQKINENRILSKKIKKIKTEVNKISRKLSQVNKWKKFFKDLLTCVDRIQRLSINNYTESFGPAASRVQNKLRRIHGFGALKLIPKERSICLQIENRFLSTLEQEMLAPNEYLSASQMQLITLSIFLSAAISQTWSSFSTILLDDPVQHFDDLNSHNFADLIRNLVTNNAESQYQIIISTCDETFFKSLQAKLPANRVLSYRFQEINENGPIVYKI